MAFNTGGGGISGATDVALSAPVNDHVLSYNGATSKWVNKSVSAGTGSVSIASLPAGVTLTVRHTGSSWPPRPTSRADIVVQWIGGTSQPVAAVSGTDIWVSGSGVFTLVGAGGGVALPANPSGGSGGPYTDRTNVTFSTNGGTVSSRYHIYASKISTSQPVGVVIHLHGDGAQEYSTPNTGMLPQYRSVADAAGMLFVAPLSPDDVGSITWWEDTYSTTWLAALIDDIAAKYNIDRNRVWFTGYSGGAEAISYFLMRTLHTRWTGGGAILLAGGGGSSQNPNPALSQSLKDNFQMHWVVGSRDSPAQGGDDGGFDAVAASLAGYNYYTSRGITSTRTILDGLDHYQAESHGPTQLALRLNG